MNILSEEDFARLKSTGLLYVVEPDCGGTYESYLKIYGKDAPTMDSELSWVGLKLKQSFLPEVDMSSCLPMPPVKPPLGLRPKHIVAKERMKEILEAMGRYVEDGKRIPVEWLEELGEVNGILKGEK